MARHRAGFVVYALTFADIGAYSTTPTTGGTGTALGTKFADTVFSSSNLTPIEENYNAASIGERRYLAATTAAPTGAATASLVYKFDFTPTDYRSSSVKIQEAAYLLGGTGVSASPDNSGNRICFNWHPESTGNYLMGDVSVQSIAEKAFDVKVADRPTALNGQARDIYIIATTQKRSGLQSFKITSASPRQPNVYAGAH